MTLAGRISDLATRVAEEFNAVRAEMPEGGGGGGASGWTQIATSGELSGVQFEFASIPQSYSDLILLLDDVSHNNGSSANLRLKINDGVWFPSGATVAVGFAASGAVTGCIFLPGYAMARGAAYVSTSASFSSTAQMPTSSAPFACLAWRLPGGIKGLVIEPTSGSFDGGVVTLYGR